VRLPHEGHRQVAGTRESRYGYLTQATNRNGKRFRGGLVFKAHRLVYYSTQGSRVMKKRERVDEMTQTLPFDTRCLLREAQNEACRGEEGPHVPQSSFRFLFSVPWHPAVSLTI